MATSGSPYPKSSGSGSQHHLPSRTEWQVPRICSHSSYGRSDVRPGSGNPVPRDDDNAPGCGMRGAAWGKR